MAVTVTVVTKVRISLDIQKLPTYPQFRRLSFYCFSWGLIDCFFLYPDFLADQRPYMEVCLCSIYLFTMYSLCSFV